ncbi:MAG: hypothetical protein FJX52_09975 [Alphaproteobacteria bacterium]|nr:hypothetical protein [Alphaproteobacteria bacterium]
MSADQRQAMIAFVERMAKSPQWQDELKKRDWTDILQTGDAFSAYIDSETKRIEGILKTLGLA